MIQYGININDPKSITKFFTALGDPIRLEITRILGEKGELNVGELTQHFDISRPSISHHLKVLKDASIVESKKVGQEVYYWLDREFLSSNLRLLSEALGSENCRE